jgi:hypothetical protein
MVVACESLKPAGEAYDYHNIYDVIEALLGKKSADVLRENWFRPQETRNAYFHRGELRGNEFGHPPFMSSFQDPSFAWASMVLRLIPPAAILEWLRLGGNLRLPPKRPSWRKKLRLGPGGTMLLFFGGAVCLALGWLFRGWLG